VLSAKHNQGAVALNERRRAWPPYSWLFLLIALSIFAWGTSYKLSLYKINPPGTVTPAKLCKLASDNAKSQVDQVVEGRKVAFSDFAINTGSAFIRSVFIFRGQVAPRTDALPCAPLQSAPTLHLRPPPAPDNRMFL
jgi:hypothetical protein